MGDACHNGSSTSTGTATHTSGDKHHLGVIIKEGCDLGFALLGSTACRLGDVTCTEAMSRIRSQQDAVRHRRLVELLPVGIEDNKRNTLNILHIHVVDGIVTATADTHHLDDSHRFVLVLET